MSQVPPRRGRLQLMLTVNSLLTHLYDFTGISECPADVEHLEAGSMLDGLEQWLFDSFGLARHGPCVFWVAVLFALWKFVPWAPAPPSVHKRGNADLDLFAQQQDGLRLAVIPNEVSPAQDELIREFSRKGVTEIGLRESEERLHLLLESSVVTAASYTLDPVGNVESWNVAA